VSGGRGGEVRSGWEGREGAGETAQQGCGLEVREVSDGRGEGR